MATLKQEILFFNDEFGRTRPGAKIFTYAAGTTTQKATYTDSDLANANPWPVVADGAGIFPPIYLGTGGYRVVVKDQNDVQLYDRDNLNIADTSVITTSYLVFDNLVDAKQGILIDGQSVSPQIGQAVRTLGLNTATDGEGAEWVVVAGGTGTADDDLFADLDNGNQIQRLFNQVYTERELKSNVYDDATGTTALDTSSFVEGFYVVECGTAASTARASRISLMIYINKSVGVSYGTAWIRADTGAVIGNVTVKVTNSSDLMEGSSTSGGGALQDIYINRVDKIDI